MADNNANNRPAAWFRRVNKRLDTLDNNMDSLYQSTYTSRSDNKKDMDRIVGDIDDTIDRIINGGEGPKVSDISNLYTRIQKKQGVSNKEIIDSAMELFADNDIISSLSMSQDITKYLQAEDYQYDLICKYMPSIETALEIKKDNVLSSDNFSKDFLNVTSSTSSIKNDFNVFNDRARATLKKYKFQDLCEEIVERAYKYGEAFIYIVPYNLAFQRLLQRRTQFQSTGLIRSYSESGTTERKVKTRPIPILEGANLDKGLKDQLSAAKYKVDGLKDCSVNLIFNDNCIINEAVEERENALRVALESKQTSLCEAYNIMQEQAKAAADGTGEALTEKDDDPAVTFQSVYSKRKSSSTLDGGVNDGLYVDGTMSSNSSDKIDEMSGCVVELLDRSDVLPIYMDNLCVGYYYFLFDQLNELDTCIHGQPSGMTSGYGLNNSSGTFQNTEMAEDMLLSYVAQKLSDNIDAHFINANKDLKEEIYAILKYNDKFSVITGCNNITVTFIPAEDIYHFYFKQDPDSHRGISAIQKALVPAMLYCLLYLTNTIGEVTRAQDHRIYYVRQNVETNVARTLMNVINQIKRGNMGMRQIQSMNSILGIVGRYNDFVIPQSSSGDSPIQFEVMQGQDIKTPSELMDRFENQAVESTDVPYEFTQSVNQVDYATRFTMSNSKFLRKVYKDQRICQDAFSEMFTKIYNYEYGESEKTIKVLLPAPAFLSMTNTQQLVDNTKNYVNAIIESEIPGEDDKIKQETTRILMRNFLGSYVDYDTVDEAITKARLEVAGKSNGGGDDEGSSY